MPARLQKTFRKLFLKRTKTDKRRENLNLKNNPPNKNLKLENLTQVRFLMHFQNFMQRGRKEEKKHLKNKEDINHGIRI